ncbi:MAG: hypothetical protein CMJ19_05770 [Phycisphaeraceae bacterium]|nr:hypothetical protein [Phycisphaeraceae bacterium]
MNLNKETEFAMQQSNTTISSTDKSIQTRRFGYLHMGYGPASLAAGLIVAGILGMMLSFT